MYIDEVIDRPTKVFEALQASNIKLNARKCKFFQQEVKFLGHVISEHRVQTDESKIEKVKSWPKPSSVKKLQTFLERTKYYRRFVKGFAEIVSPLTKLTSVKYFKWSLEAQNIFYVIKLKLCSSPILAFPNFKDDASYFVLDHQFELF